MRIAYLCADPGVPVFGQKGCSIHVQEVIRGLLGAGHQVELFAARFGGPPSDDLAGLPLYRLPKTGRRQADQDEAAARVFNREVEEQLSQAGTFDFYYERYSLWCWAGMEWAQKARRPGLLEVNAPLIEEQAEHRGLSDPGGARRAAQRVFGAARHLICVSQEVAAYLDTWTEARGRICTIENGVNPARFGLPSLPPGPRTPFTIGFVGTLKPWHGLRVLAGAFGRFRDRVPEARLIVVGDGPERERLKKDLAAHHVTNAVQLTGRVDPTQIPSLLGSMQVAVAPYPQLSSFYFSPLKIFEYMAASLPVVASRIGQISRVLEHEVTGLLCPAGETAPLCDALVRLHRDRGLGRRLGKAARKKVIRDHTWDSVVDQILALSASDRPSAYGSRGAR